MNLPGVVRRSRRARCRRTASPAGASVRSRRGCAGSTAACRRENPAERTRNSRMARSPRAFSERRDARLDRPPRGARRRAGTAQIPARRPRPRRDRRYRRPGRAAASLRCRSGTASGRFAARCRRTNRPRRRWRPWPRRPARWPSHAPTGAACDGSVRSSLPSGGEGERPARGQRKRRFDGAAVVDATRQIGVRDGRQVEPFAR